MIPELGQISLLLALAVALVLGTLPIIGAARGRHDWMALARPAAQAHFVLVVAARDMPDYLALAQRLFTADANVRNVKAFFSVKRSKFSPRVLLPQRG